jgi:hypothetical protein
MLLTFLIDGAFSVNVISHASGICSDRRAGASGEVLGREQLVGRRIRPYAAATSRRLPLMSDRAIASMPRVGPAAWAGAGIVGALAAVTALLWAYYGSAVFFETIMSGLALCF